MTALLAAAFLAGLGGLTGVGLSLYCLWQLRRVRLETRTEALRADRAEAAFLLLAGAHAAAVADAAGAVADLGERNARLTAERDEAVSRGEKAALASMSILAHERAEFLTSLQAWQGIAGAALLLATPTPQLPPSSPSDAAPTAPELLAGGEHAYVDGDPGLLVQLDGDPLYDGPLPAGTVGTQRTATKPRARKKAAE